MKRRTRHEAKRMNRYLCLAAAIFCTVNGTAVQAEVESEKAVIDMAAEEFLMLDRVSLLYDNMLKEIREYVDGEGLLEDAVSSAEETSAQIDEMLQAAQLYVLDQEMSSAIEENGLSVEEYEFLMNTHITQQQEYTKELYAILQNLEWAGTDEAAGAPTDWLEEMLELWEEGQQLEKEYWYYSTNYFFCTWDEELQDYASELILDQYQSFNLEEEWCETCEEAEEELLLNVEALEALDEKYARMVGEKENELHEMEGKADVGLESE